jgi:hypothetical protein
MEEVVDPSLPAIPLEELPCNHHESLACMASICHHMGQPATVLLVSLNLLNKKLQDSSDDTRRLVRNLNEAADTISRMLRDMNKLCENTPVDEPEDYPDPLAPHIGHVS